MSLGKKLAVIAQLALLNAVWLLNIAVYQKYNYFSEARHLRYIPQGSLLCGSVRTSDIAGKLIYQYLYNRPVFETYFRKHEIKSLAESSPFKIGIDPNDQVSFYAERNKQGGFLHAGVLVDLLNEDDFHAYLKKNKWKKIGSSASVHVFSGGNGFYAANNHEVVLFMKIDLRVSENITVQTIESMYKMASPANKMRKKLLVQLKKNHDFVITGYSRELIIQSPLLNSFTIMGEFSDDRIALLSEFYFNRNMQEIFPEHKINPTFDFDELDAFFLLQGNFNVSNADIVPENLGVISFSDSLSLLLKRTLHSRACSKLQAMAHGFKKVTILSDDEYSDEVNFALNKGMGMLPEFIFGIHCVQASKMDSLLKVLSVTDTFLHESEDGFYRYTYNNYDMYMRARDGIFNIQSNRDMHQLQFPETGFSNFIFMDYNKMREAIPNFLARAFATEYDLIKHFVMYSTDCKERVLWAKGEVVIEKDKNALLEIFKTDEKILKWKELKATLLKQTAKDFE
ncbi:MAG: hypothetical protein ACHQF2_02960 [Flavobacteriales bacterium]